MFGLGENKINFALNFMAFPKRRLQTYLFTILLLTKIVVLKKEKKEMSKMKVCCSFMVAYMYHGFT